jgi:ArsR family transcriptional regulator, arsenate/arsenite/antimonite-responsive transcriptional repressor
MGRRVRSLSGAGSFDAALYFDYSGNVETEKVIDALSALAHDTRLRAFRLLVEAGPEGLPAGSIGDKLSLPAATLSFHLAHLARAGLARSRQDGRFVIYSADFQSTNELVGFLTENCCGGRSCAPASPRSRSVKGAGHEAPPRARRRA